MKRKKTRSVASYRAAALKAWRSKRLMAKARGEELFMRTQTGQFEIKPHNPHADWPYYMKRALPLPSFGNDH